MNKIQVKILNPEVVQDSEKMMVAMARLTQAGHKISTIEDFEELLAKQYSKSLVGRLVDLPHPTIQKFGVINVIVIGASRRFLAQITRHQNEVKFMSGSLQYSDYSDSAQFVVPYEITQADSDYSGSEKYLYRKIYLQGCEASMRTYTTITEHVGQDAAGYAMPQGLRNVLLISATPFQWAHMIRQRTCNRNSLETQYVMLRIWEQLYPLSEIFHDCGPFCSNKQGRGCPEGTMACGSPWTSSKPWEILKERFRLIYDR